MAAFIVFGDTLGDHAADIISSFLYRSQTVVSICDSDASDIANLDDVRSVSADEIWPFSDAEIEMWRYHLE